MTAQTLDRVIRCDRIGDPAGEPDDLRQGALFDGDAGKARPWQRQPAPQSAFHRETATPAHLPGWDHIGCAASKAHGEAWQRSKRSLPLFVPSVVAGLGANILINPEHPEFSGITHGLHQPVWWDARLFASVP